MPMKKERAGATAIMSTAGLGPNASAGGNKRKRDLVDSGESGRALRSNPQEANGSTQVTDDVVDPDMSQIREQLLQNLNENGDQQLPPHQDNQQTAQAALQTSQYPNPDQSFDATGDGQYALAYPDGADITQSTQSQLQAARDVTANNASKPAVGTTEWHAQRKNNHKEVERRRRETINEGINELQKIVPGGEKNKGAILQSAIEHINEINGKTRSWDTERATFDITRQALEDSNDRLKASSRDGWAMADKWQKRCKDAGLVFDDYAEFNNVEEGEAGEVGGN